MEYNQHINCVSCIKFNENGEYLSSGSLDKTVVIWNIKENTLKRKYNFNSKVVDFDWKDNQKLLVCGSSGTIIYYDIELDTPIKTYNAHKEDVNAVRWNPDKTLFASCSDDQSIKIWNEESDNSICEFNHDSSVFQLDWCKSTRYHNYLASASYDKTVIIWDIDKKESVYKFDKHNKYVYSVSFSPFDDYIASCSMNDFYIWSIKDGSIVTGYNSNHTIFEVKWNKKGDKVALSSQKIVAIINFI